MEELELRKKIQEHVELIKYSPRALNEAPDRATTFLVMIAVLLDEKRSVDEDLIKLETLSSAAHNQAMDKHGDKKSVTAQKSAAENDNFYVEMREAKDRCEKKISWLKGYIEMFNNAHILYRQFCKE